jgi:hypothetical protein
MANTFKTVTFAAEPAISGNSLCYVHSSSKYNNNSCIRIGTS